MLGRLLALLVFVAIAWLLYDSFQPGSRLAVDLGKGTYRGVADAPLSEETRRALDFRARDPVEPMGRLSP